MSIRSLHQSDAALGDKLGPYEILAPIGTGGMGELYRAKDTKAGARSGDQSSPLRACARSERLARFKREGKVLASLNHPKIATRYGAEESNGVRVLVM